MAEFPNLTPVEIAAYLGAAAWAPQVARWLYDWLRWPTVRLVVDDKAEIGFTSLGPIFNLRIALWTDHKDLVVEELLLEVKHENGETRTFRWAGTREDLAESRDHAGATTRMAKDHVPIAMKLGPSALADRSFRFQEPRYSEDTEPVLDKLIAQFNFWRQTKPDYVELGLKSKELFDLIAARENAFWWKAGTYEVTFIPKASSFFRYKKQKYSLFLSATDVQTIKNNLPIVKFDLEQTLKSNLPDYKLIPLVWNWRYPKFRKVSEPVSIGAP